MKRGARVAVLFVLIGCAALTRREKVQLSEDRLSRARELDAAHLASEPYARFESARALAEGLAKDAPEREEHVSEARLWLETAIAEAESAALSQKRLALERETVRHDQAYLAAERERFALEDERDRVLAAGIAREEATRALARASQIAQLHVKLSADETRRAASALLTRAELIALALSPEENTAARSALLSQVEQARTLLTKAPEEALKQADQALLQGLALVGKARDASSAPTAEQKASLAEALSLLGATVSRVELGLSAALGEKGVANGIARLCSLSRDYPAGGVQVALHAGSELALLGKHGCDGKRFVILPARGAQPGLGQRPAPAQLSFTFLAY